MIETPFISVSGTHFECGRQIGSAFKEKIHRFIEISKLAPPENLSWQACLDNAKGFLDATERYFPEIVDEIKGAAEGSDVSFLELFTTGIEELYSKNFHIKDCTDIITLPPASGHTLVAHNNDLSPNLQDIITSVEWNFEDGSRMFTVGIAGIFVSVGVNSSKIVLSGNELTPNDTRVGIPRALIARAILLAKTFDEAVKIAIHPERASSYNNIITTLNQSISIEGSATSFDYLFPVKGILIHSNHYISPKMLRFEAHPNENTSSIERLRSANKLTKDLDKPIDLKTIESFLQDHGDNATGTNDTLCRHGNISETVFGFAVDLDLGIVELSDGKPCERPFRKVWEIK